MRTPLLAIAAAALLSGSVAAYAQNTAPVDQTRDHHAQPADQMQQHDQATPDRMQGATPHNQMQPGTSGTRSSAPDMMNRDRNLQPSQMQTGRDRIQDQDRDRPQGGEMLRGGEERGEGHHPLTVRERTNLRETVLRSGPRLSHVNFRIGVGAIVPRNVRLVAVPRPIVAIYPEWSGDLFFSYGDEIVVVQPDSMQIVGVLPL
jgi:hypothetical protein